MLFENSNEAIGVKIEFSTQGDSRYGVQNMLMETTTVKTFAYINDCVDNFMSGLGKISYVFQTSNDTESFEQLKVKLKEGILKNFVDSVSSKYKVVYSVKVQITGRQTGILKVSLKYV